ncbi:NAD(P)-binding protein [Roseibium salinum]|uniref:NAD(P)-binding protein n=1 Tax=Roseibium salinum TaxID=1604349 RepID=UPI00361304A9
MTQDGDVQHPIVIAGAGIGGLAAALALAQQGHRIVLMDRARQLSEVGAGLQLSQCLLGPGPARRTRRPEARCLRAGFLEDLVGKIGPPTGPRATRQLHRAAPRISLLGGSPRGSAAHSVGQSPRNARHHPPAWSGGPRPCAVPL